MAEYKPGMVSQLLGENKQSSGGELDAFFSVPAVAAKQAQPPKSHSQDARSEKKKKKKVAAISPPVEEAEDSPPRKKAKVKVNGDKSGKSGRITGISAKSPTSSQGYNPPPGIVHEALAETGQKPGGKRKLSASDDDDEESEDDYPKKGIKEGERPRRDRLKRVNEKRTIFIGNVPLTADKKKLTRLFKQFGKIESVRFRCAPIGNPATKKRVAVITKEFHEKRHNISAYICFKEETAAKEAVALNGHLLDGFHLRVDSAKPDVKNLSKRSVFVGNLPFAIEEENIRQHFEPCGEIENVRVVRDRKTNLGKGICYILFKSQDSVSKALKLKNSELDKRQLRVERCVESSQQKDAKGKKLNTSGDRKPTSSKERKLTKNGSRQISATDQKEEPRKKKRRMWQPTNASALQIVQAHKTALKKKQRKGEKLKKKKSKVDEINRVLGPAQQKTPSAKADRSSGGGAGKKAKAKRKDMKGEKKGKKRVR